MNPAGITNDWEETVVHFRHTFLKSVVAGAVAVALTSGIAMAVTRGTGTVTTDALRLRSQANTNSATLTFAPRDSVVTLLEELDGKGGG